MAQSCGAADLANTLLPSLIDGKSFKFPDINLNDPDFNIPDKDDNPIFNDLKSLTNADLTEKNIEGNGTFDVVLNSVSKALQLEFKAGRISGNTYANVFMESMAHTLQNSVQYLLGKDQAFWQAALIQQQAQREQIEIVKAKLEATALKYGLVAAYYQAMNSEAEYGLTKMKISTEDATYCATVAQKEQVDYTTKNILPVQRDLTKEQVESARAQTLDTRTDGQVVKGSVGKQKDLYTQQITSYQRDSEVKAAKLFTDAWITQKTIDEGLLAPNGFTNASLDQVLVVLKRNNGFS